MRPTILFMGSPEAAVPALRAAHRIGLVRGVVTQPDRPAGRGRRPMPTPVALAAEEIGIPVHRPEKPNAADFVAMLGDLCADVVLVVAYGRILRPRMLACTRFGCVNVHFSLLPRHRGAAPVERAIRAGDERTGVSLMLLDDGIDTGPLLAQRETPIGPDETAGELTARLADVGAALVEEALPRYLAEEIVPRPQPAEGATYAPMLEKDEGRIRWDRPALDVHRHIRAVTPRPGACAFLDGVRIRIHRTRLLPWAPSPGPGRLVIEGKRLLVGAADTCIEILELQREGRRCTDAACFLAGSRLPEGECLACDGDDPE